MGHHGHGHGHGHGSSSSSSSSNLLSFGGRKEAASSAAPPPTPKGCVGIRVGPEGEEQQRFVVPLVYLDHPLFLGLLKAAEEEYGFHHKGAITIPCHVDYFRQIQNMIEQNNDDDTCNARHHHHHHHLFQLNACFRGLKA